MNVHLRLEQILGCNDRPSGRRGPIRQSINVTITAAALFATLWLRNELFGIDDVDLVPSCPSSQELSIVMAELANSGRAPRAIDQQAMGRRFVTDEFEMRRDRLAGLNLEPERRRSCYDFARERDSRLCEIRFAALSATFGESRVRRALQWRYGSAEEIARYYFSKICQLAFPGAIAASGAAFVFLSIKVVNSRAEISCRDLSDEAHVDPTR